MINNRLVKFFITIFVGFIFLTACSGGGIAKVKESKINGWPDFTIGQMLDKRHACSETSWRQFKDDRGRDLVEYKCISKFGMEIFQSNAKYVLAKAQEYIDYVKTDPNFTGDVNNIVMEKLVQKKQIEEKSSKVTAVTELVQWVVKDNDIVYLGSALEVHGPEGTLNRQLASDTIFKNAAKNPKDHRGLSSSYDLQLGDMYREYMNR